MNSARLSKEEVTVAAHDGFGFAPRNGSGVGSLGRLGNGRD